MLYRYDVRIQEVVSNLREWFKGDRGSDARTVRQIERQSRVTGNISAFQMKLLGCIYKRTIQNGRYVHHNWPIWQKKTSQKAS